MDLGTTWLGLHLPHPIVAGASPLCDDLDVVRRLADSGAAALVMHSLFEEQITAERDATYDAMDLSHEGSAEARSYFIDPGDYRLGPAAYLRQIERLKSAVRLPVVASLNGTTSQGWVRYARHIEEAGADALELNVYFLATLPDEPGSMVEDRVLRVAEAVVANVRIPVSVKLSPFFGSIPHMVRRLEDLNVAGVVLFNRFYQPDFDVEKLEVVPSLTLSDSTELRLRLRWLAILHGRTALSLACSGGVHTPEDVVKAVMAGADAVQTVSALLRHGPERIGWLLDGFQKWLVDHEYTSVNQLRGSMSLLRSPDPAAFERANYTRILNTWKPA